MFSLLSLQSRYVLTKRDGIESTADIFRWWNNENKCSLLLAFSEDSLLTVPFALKNADIVSVEIYLWTGNFPLEVSLHAPVQSWQFSECTVRMRSSTVPLKHYWGHTRSTLSWKFFHHSLQVLLTFLITVILSAKVPLARNHLTIHRKHPALCSKIHVSWPEPVASSLLISSCSLTVTCCKQDKHQHLTPQSPLPN